MSFTTYRRPRIGYGNGKDSAPEEKYCIGMPMHHFNFLLKHMHKSLVFSLEPKGANIDDDTDIYVEGSVFDNLHAKLMYGKSKNTVWSRYDTGENTTGKGTQNDNNDDPLYFYKWIVLNKLLRRSPDTDIWAFSVIDHCCPAGYILVQPMYSELWKECTNAILSVETKGGFLLFEHPKEHSPKTSFCFNAPWPDIAKEWIDRKRTSSWPDNDIVKRVVDNGCHIIPKSHPLISCTTMWKYSFSKAERLLVSIGSTAYQKECFHWLQLIVKYCLTERSKIEYGHLKSIFLYACEKLSVELWQKQRVVCIFQMLKDLLKSFQDGVLPNYFVSQQNMIDSINITERTWHIKRLTFLCRNFFMTLYFMMDGLDLIWYSDLYCVDVMAEDVPRFLVHTSTRRTVEECLLPYSVCIPRRYIQILYCDMALEQTVSLVEELNQLSANQVGLGLETFLQRVIESVSLPKKVCFAIYVDLTAKTSLLQHVCQGHETVAIDTLCGPEIMTALGSALRIPKQCSEPEFVSSFICDLHDVMKKSLKVDTETLNLCLHNFLHAHSGPLLKVASNADTPSLYHEYIQLILTSLRLVYFTLYTSYLQNEDPYRFVDLMDAYEELVDQVNEVDAYRQLFYIWRTFNRPEKMELARVKMHSLSSDDFDVPS